MHLQQFFDTAPYTPVCLMVAKIRYLYCQSAKFSLFNKQTLLKTLLCSLKSASVVVLKTYVLT